MTTETIAAQASASDTYNRVDMALRRLADAVTQCELAEGELLELTRLAARVVRVFETSHNGGVRR